MKNTLRRLWPQGDSRVPGLLPGMVQSSEAVFARYGITTPLLAAHVMAQISHECGAGRDVVENMNYSAGRMMQVWPSRFPTMASAQPYAGNPRALANKVYNGRMGNAVGSDDGWNFRGRGGSQTTGREGYERVKKATGIDVVSHPDYLIDPRYFLTCAVSDFIDAAACHLLETTMSSASPGGSMAAPWVSPSGRRGWRNGRLRCAMRRWRPRRPWGYRP